MAERQLILEGVTLLALVLERARIDAVGCEHRRVVGHFVGVIGAVGGARRSSGGVVERILVGEEHLVEPAVGAALPAKIDARVGVARNNGRGLRQACTDTAVPGLAADLALQHKAIVGGWRPIELAEIQVLGEVDRCRAELCRRLSWQLGNDVRRHVAPDIDRDRRLVAFALVGHEEMHDVLDDRPTEGQSELLVLGRRLDVRDRIELTGCFGPEVIVAVQAEDLALEVISAGSRLGSHRRARDLIVFGLVVGGDDLVLTDRELRERIPLGLVRLPAQAASHVPLLTYTVDIHIDRVVVLRAGADRGMVVLIDAEHDTRHCVGELEEVTCELRHGLDVVQRDDLADLGGLGLDETGAAHRHGLELAKIQNLG